MVTEAPVCECDCGSIVKLDRSRVRKCVGMDCCVSMPV